MSATNNNYVLEAYVFFDGRCDEAIEFYRKALGAEVEMLLRFKDSPEAGVCTTANAEKVMHSSLRIGNNRLLVSDGRGQGQPKFEGFTLSLLVPNEAEADRLFALLGDGGQVQMPLSKTFFSKRFGMLTDRFGVAWMIRV